MTDTDTDTTGSDAQPEAQADEAQADEAGQAGNPNAEAKKYRRRLRETEAERDQLAERLTAMQRAEAERLATGEGALMHGRDLWIDGLDLGDLLDDDGNVSRERVAEAAGKLLAERPGLGWTRDPDFGARRTAPAAKPGPSFADLVQRARQNRM